GYRTVQWAAPAPRRLSTVSGAAHWGRQPVAQKKEILMKRFSIKQSVVMVGAVAALALGTGIVPGAANSTPTAQAAELAQHGGGHGMGQHRDGGIRHEGRRDYREEFRGHRFWYREGFEHQ